MFRLALALCAMAFPMDLLAQTHGHSPYAGLEGREIKSLSEADLEDLRLGRGWGLALAAELNGVPGPAHLLELQAELGLDAGQVAAIEDLFEPPRVLPEGKTLGELPVMEQNRKKTPKAVFTRVPRACGAACCGAPRRISKRRSSACCDRQQIGLFARQSSRLGSAGPA